jgi:hypothetical protein
MMMLRRLLKVFMPTHGLVFRSLSALSRTLLEQSEETVD